MPGKVFISCGQWPGREQRLAEAVKSWFENRGFAPYLAVREQTLQGVTELLNELRSSDYFVFIDFHRDNPEKLPISLFTHQELAWAYQLGFCDNVIAFRDPELPAEGEGLQHFLRANPEAIESDETLLDRLEHWVNEKGWSPTHSRSLLVVGISEHPPIRYGDRDGGQQWQKIWTVAVRNQRMDAAAVGTVCALEDVRPEGSLLHVDQSPLKWAGLDAYERTILPRGQAAVACFGIRLAEPGFLGSRPGVESGVVLHTLADVWPRKPIIREDGDYRLTYSLVSHNFPPVSFGVQLRYRWSRPEPGADPRVSWALPGTSARLTVPEPRRDGSGLPGGVR